MTENGGDIGRQFNWIAWDYQRVLAAAWSIDWDAYNEGEIMAPKIATNFSTDEDYDAQAGARTLTDLKAVEAENRHLALQLKAIATLVQIDLADVDDTREIVLAIQHVVNI